MKAIWARWHTVVEVWLLAQLLVAVVTVLVVRWRRSHGLPARHAWRLTAAECALVSGTAPWLWMAFTPVGAGRFLSLDPWRDLAEQLSGDPGTAGAQITANLLVFAAVGAFAPLRWRVGLPAVLATATAGSVSIEAIQYVAAIGRVTSAGDVILNVTGAALAALATRPWYCV